MQNQLTVLIVTDLAYLRQVSKKTNKEKVNELKLKLLLQFAIHKGWVFGYGLAAIQIGIPIRAGWYWLPSDKSKDGHMLINPEILERREPIIKANEGCLSIPQKTCTVKRYNKIKYINEDKEFEAEGLEAQIIQHEIDHMDGILIIDREYVKQELGRNDLCSCNSGRKYKKCCLGKE